MIIGYWLERRVKSFRQDRDRRRRTVGPDSSLGNWNRRTILQLVGAVAEAIRTGDTRQSSDADTRAIITRWLTKELNNLRSNLGRISKKTGVSANQATTLVLSLLPEISQALMMAYSFEQKNEQ